MGGHRDHLKLARLIAINHAELFHMLSGVSAQTRATDEAERRHDAQGNQAAELDVLGRKHPCDHRPVPLVSGGRRTKPRFPFRGSV